MKKYLVSALATFVLVSFGSVFAQETASHDLQVTIPEIVAIRIQPTPAADVETTNVVFDFATAGNQQTYLDALEVDGGTWLQPTSFSLGDIEVLAAGTGWRVTVGTSGALTTTGIGLARVRVTPTSFAPFTLASLANIATGAATTWQSLGISGDSYELFVDGTETAGDDTITVTYSIFAN